MHAVTRLEIIANSVELEKLLATLDRVGVPGYTVMRNVTGKSPRGNVSDDVLENVYVIAFFPPEQNKAVVEAVQPILNRLGGVCYLSEAIEVRSIRCVASM